MAISRFEEIISWQKGQDLALEIYKEFRDLKEWGFKDQICRAAVSVSNNIAEGFDRQSQKEFCRFLYISSGSVSEVRSMLYLADKLNYMTSEKCRQLIQLAEEISRINKGLIKAISK